MSSSMHVRLPAPDGEEVLAVLDDLASEAQYPPTLREIADRLGHPLSTMHGTLVELRQGGIVDWEDRKPRTLRRVDPKKMVKGA